MKNTEIIWFNRHLINMVNINNIEKVAEIFLYLGKNNTQLLISQTALNIAVSNNNFKIAKLLLDSVKEEKAELFVIKKAPIGHYTLIHTAIENVNLPMIKLIIEKAKRVLPDLFSMVDKDNNTPLHTAIKVANPEMVELLIDKISGPFSVAYNKDTPLKMALQLDTIEKVEKLFNVLRQHEKNLDIKSIAENLILTTKIIPDTLNYTFEDYFKEISPLSFKKLTVESITKTFNCTLEDFLMEYVPEKKIKQEEDMKYRDREKIAKYVSEKYVEERKLKKEVAEFLFKKCAQEEMSKEIKEDCNELALSKKIKKGDTTYTREDDFIAEHKDSTSHYHNYYSDQVDINGQHNE